MKAISVPLKLINLQDNGFHLLVEIFVFGKSVLAVLDTGASRSVFDLSLLQQHIVNLAENTAIQTNTIFSTATTLFGIIDQFRIGSLNLNAYEAVGLDLQSVNDTYQLMGHPLIGAIIGGDILHRYQAKIDYKKSILTLYK